MIRPLLAGRKLVKLVDRSVVDAFSHGVLLYHIFLVVGVRDLVTSLPCFFISCDVSHPSQASSPSPVVQERANMVRWGLILEAFDLASSMLKLV